MRGAGILQLLADDTSGSYHAKLYKILSKGVRRCERNALDLAGKVPFSLLMKRIGVDRHKLWVDSAQAGGLYDTADAFLPREMAYVEIKGAKLKSGTKRMGLLGVCVQVSRARRLAGHECLRSLRLLARRHSKG